MKKLVSTFIALAIIVSTLITPAYATNSDDMISPHAYGTYTETILLSIKVPAYYSSVQDLYVEEWTFPLRLKYRIQYNLNTGEITSVESLGTSYTGTATSPTEQAIITALNYENLSLKIVNNGNAFSWSYSATATILYNARPGLPLEQEVVRKTVSGNGTVYPPRP